MSSECSCSLLLMFFTVCPPPCSTLLPYTTLFRSVIESKIVTASHSVFTSNVVDQIIQPTLVDILARGRGAIVSRSEEHTSELQSRGRLVCRLLLEKKNHCIA